MARKSQRDASPRQWRSAEQESRSSSFLNSAQGKAGKREIARAFGVSGGARIALKRLLAEMAAEGTLARRQKAPARKGQTAARHGA